MSNKISRGMTKDGFVRFFLIDSTQMVEEARKIHQTTPISTAALGRTITAASLLGAMCKGEKEKITLQIKGSNLIKSILAVSDQSGNVKGYISNPNVDLPLNDKGKLPVGEAVGANGKLIFIKDLGLKEPYIGNSNLVSGEIAEDLAAYFMYSEQQPSFVSLGVFINSDVKVGAAGGLIIQVLPDAPEEVLVKLEGSLGAFPAISELIREGMSFKDMMNLALNDFEVVFLSENEVMYKCDCSEEKIEKVIISLGEKEITDLIEEDGKAEVVCHFCNTKYQFGIEKLQTILEKALD
ncbi:MAG: Hsp33 family molecular chaperone HslO [Acidaminobacteraceae bacterium]